MVGLFLVIHAAWVSTEISVKCVGALRSFPLPFFHYALLSESNKMKNVVDIVANNKLDMWVDMSIVYIFILVMARNVMR